MIQAYPNISDPPPPPQPAGGPAPTGAASRPSWCAYSAAAAGIAGAILNAHAPASPLVAELGLLAQTAWVVGNALWLTYAARTGQRPLAAQALVFLLISGYVLTTWGRAVWRF